MESTPYIMQELVERDILTALGQPFILNCPIAGKPQVN